MRPSSVAATSCASQAMGPSLVVGSTWVHRETNLVSPVPPPHTIAATHTSALKDKFVKHVMCNYTPRHPQELPTWRWVSYLMLFNLMQPHAPMEVWMMGPGNLKQLLTHWFSKHPTFAGLDPSMWCNSTVKVPASAVPQLGSCVSSACVWRIWAARRSQEEASPLGTQPLPRVLEPAASKAADFTSFDHVGASGSRSPTRTPSPAARSTSTSTNSASSTRQELAGELWAATRARDRQRRE